MVSKPTTALMGAGVFSLSLAVLTVVAVQPALMKAPVVKATVSVGTGPATSLNSTTGQQVPGTFTSTRVVGTAVENGKNLGGGDVAVYDSFTTNTFLAEGGTASRVLSQSTYTQAFDRSTGAGLPTATGDTANTAGNIFKMPFGTEKKTYQGWDDNSKLTLPWSYLGEKTIQGLKVYEFGMDVPPTNLGELPVLKAIPGALVGHPEAASIPADQWMENPGKRLYVEPVTGSLVGGVSNPHYWAQTTGPTLSGLKLDLLKVDGAVPDGPTQATLIKDATDSKSSVQLLQRAPWVLGLLGLLLLAGGVLLQRRKTEGAAPAHAARTDVSGILPRPRKEPTVNPSKVKS